MRILPDHPLRAVVALLLAALVLRLADIFVLRLDERWGELLLSKALGFLLVVGYVRAAGRRAADIGFHGRHLGPAVAVGVTVTALALVLGYGAEWAYLARGDHPPSLVVGARAQPLVAAVASLGGVWMAVWLVFGNAVNSSMEEGLFRGVMLTHLQPQLSPWRANFLQALLFGAWHFVWPLKMFLDGRLAGPQALALAAFYLIASGIVGLLYGYMFQRTGSLWAPWVAHTLHNSTLNLVHTATPAGLDPGIAVRGLVMSAAFLLSLLVVRRMA